MLSFIRHDFFFLAANFRVSGIHNFLTLGKGFSPAELHG